AVTVGCPDGDEAVLVDRVIGIGERYGQRVAKDGCGLGKRNLVFLEGACGLVFIPLEVHWRRQPFRTAATKRSFRLANPSSRFSDSSAVSFARRARTAGRPLGRFFPFATSYLRQIARDVLIVAQGNDCLQTSRRKPSSFRWPYSFFFNFSIAGWRR